MNNTRIVIMIGKQIVRQMTFQWGVYINSGFKLEYFSLFIIYSNYESFHNSLAYRGNYSLQSGYSESLDHKTWIWSTWLWILILQYNKLVDSVEFLTLICRRAELVNVLLFNNFFRRLASVFMPSDCSNKLLKFNIYPQNSFTWVQSKSSRKLESCHMAWDLQNSHITSPTEVDCSCEYSFIGLSPWSPQFSKDGKIRIQYGFLVFLMFHTNVLSIYCLLSDPTLNLSFWKMFS